MRKDKAGRFIVSQQFMNKHVHYVRSTRTLYFYQFSNPVTAALSVVQKNFEAQMAEWFMEDHLGRRYNDLTCHDIIAAGLTPEEFKYQIAQGVTC